MRLIDADALLQEIEKYRSKGNWKSQLFLHVINSVKAIIGRSPTVDSVKKNVYEQVKWERDIAIGQLESIGKSLGEKMDNIEPVRNGHWISYPECGATKCSQCGWDTEEAWHSNYCPNCGAKML